MIREVFSSIMGEGKFIGRRFIFVRFKGCPLDCVYCDEAKKVEGICEVENVPGTGNFEECPNINEELINVINRLKTPDLFAVSFTGGEPLLYSDVIKEYSELLHDLGYKTFLESNGMYPDKVNFFDYGSIDIKLPEHFKSKDVNQWRDLYKNELKTIEKLHNMGSDVYAKIVVMEKTPESLVEDIAKDLSDIGDITLCIQPLTPYGTAKDVPSQEKIFNIMSLCGKYVDVMCTPQIHKIMGIL
ncbi:MAG: 7-carboxy-7-deazaguanine synthase [Methanothermococcus sp.]|uniref:7-carboxy-7-deazaguanine synthase QueE n=1 Tax=Methanothermococcus TaxID=155862 RepID=UPI00036CB240|nr:MULTISPECIES: 7-carboxy-7-deazaguanine synthase QueE [Methanothermococcus]MDK2790644.1 7-carboxy-7-deazaguanine synthase [Methanothermococcus sp.]MDK2987599.1 7-carboxy-7-deazaguanine synthase [Methanothermococcus sp.]